MFPLVGEAAALGAAIIWSGSTSLFKFYGNDVSAKALNLYKNIVAFICLAITALIISSPVHNHFQAIGWPEAKVVMRFWVVSGIGAAVGLIIFMLDRNF